MNLLPQTGTNITVLLKTNERFVGKLLKINYDDSSIDLSSVTAYGTEGRMNGGLEIQPKSFVFDNLHFKGQDVKDLQVMGLESIDTFDPMLNAPYRQPQRHDQRQDQRQDINQNYRQDPRQQDPRLQGHRQELPYYPRQDYRNFNLYDGMQNGQMNMMNQNLSRSQDHNGAPGFGPPHPGYVQGMMKQDIRMNPIHPDQGPRRGPEEIIHMNVPKPAVENGNRVIKQARPQEVNSSQAEVHEKKEVRQIVLAVKEEMRAVNRIKKAKPPTISFGSLDKGVEAVVTQVRNISLKDVRSNRKREEGGILRLQSDERDGVIMARPESNLTATSARPAAAKKIIIKKKFVIPTEEFDFEANTLEKEEGNEKIEGYTKSSFFDDISTDSKDRLEGFDRKARMTHDRNINVETFGETGNNLRGGYGRRGRGGRGRGANKHV